MEGKGCLFKKFAGIDVFDIELAERDPDKLVDIIAALEPTLGSVNLEDRSFLYTKGLNLQCRSHHIVQV